MTRPEVTRYGGASGTARKSGKSDLWGIFDRVKRSRSVGTNLGAMGGEVSKARTNVKVPMAVSWKDLDTDILDCIVHLLKKNKSQKLIGVLRLACKSWQQRIDSTILHLTLWRQASSAPARLSIVFPNLKSLELRCERSARAQTNLLEDARGLWHLRELDISQPWGFVTTGYQQLANLISLEKLSLNGSGLRALGETALSCPEVTSSLSHISCLVLHGCEDVRDQDFSVLKGLTSLTRLVALQARSITAQGLQSVTVVSGLRDIALTGIEKVNSSDISCLQQLANLSSLRLCRLGINNSWLERIQHLPTLKRLSLGGCDGVTDVGLRALTNLVDLSHIRLWSQSSMDITLSGIMQLRGLLKLKSLELFQCANIDQDVVNAYFDRDVHVRILPNPEKVMVDNYSARDLDVVERLLESVQELGAKEVPVPGCFTPHQLMIHAADNRDLAFLRLLVKYGADVDYGDALLPVAVRLSDCSTPLHFAVYHGDSTTAKELVELGARVDAHCTDDCRTPLHFACVGGDLEMVRILLAAGADVNCTDDCARTPLYAAVQWGQKDVIKELFKWGADPEKRDLSNHTCLHFASKVGNFDLVKFLVELGMDVDSGVRLGLPTPLQTAAEHGELAVVKFLSQQGASLYGHSPVGETPLFLAAKRGHLETVQYLLHRLKQVSSNDVLKAEDGEGKTLLHFSASHGWTNIVEELLGSEVNHPVNKGDHDGFAPLYYADKNGHKEIVRLLSKRGGLARWLNRPPLYKYSLFKGGCPPGNTHNGS